MCSQGWNSPTEDKLLGFKRGWGGGHTIAWVTGCHQGRTKRRIHSTRHTESRNQVGRVSEDCWLSRQVLGGLTSLCLSKLGKKFPVLSDSQAFNKKPECLPLCGNQKLTRKSDKFSFLVYRIDNASKNNAQPWGRYAERGCLTDCLWEKTMLQPSWIAILQFRPESLKASYATFWLR